MRRLFGLALLCLAACPKEPPLGEPSLLSSLKVGLAERDAKLTSYRFSGRTWEQGQEAAFGFAYRAPNRVKGELIRPIRRTFSFDGSKLYDLRPDQKSLTTSELKLPRARAALFLNQRFSPFAPEGFRVPLLVGEGLGVARIALPKAAHAIEVKQRLLGEGGQRLTVSYRLRWPSLDFLGKRTEQGDQVSEVRVDEELCDPALKLCFPTRYSHWESESLAATTSLFEVEINPQLLEGEFTLAAPLGFELKSEELVEPTGQR